MREAQRNEFPLYRLVMPRLLHGDCLELMALILETNTKSELFYNEHTDI